MLNLIMAISSDHFVAKGPEDKMRWTSTTDKRVFQLLTSVGGFLGAGRRTFDLLPALECRTIKCLSRNGFWTVNNFALSFPGSWLIGGQEVALAGLKGGHIRQAFLCRSLTSMLYQGIQDEITPKLQSSLNWSLGLTIPFGDTEVDVWNYKNDP